MIEFLLLMSPFLVNLWNLASLIFSNRFKIIFSQSVGTKISWSNYRVKIFIVDFRFVSMKVADNEEFHKGLKKEHFLNMSRMYQYEHVSHCRSISFCNLFFSCNIHSCWRFSNNRFNSRDIYRTTQGNRLNGLLFLHKWNNCFIYF